ncbi:MAG: SusD/RagB family nutrient-binding outer membrane lipoprotein [Bacteroidetes bacterium]|nr:MAG: SusD/RagB family nutrient-binding outer membrane lipoprotein [Bacteroidota bacterium]
MKKIFFILGVALLAVGCDPSDFGDINKNPNAPSDPLTSALFTAAMRDVAQAPTSSVGPLYSQHLSEKQYTEESRYRTINFDYAFWYTGPLANLNEIIRLNTDAETKDVSAANGSNNNQIAVARILRAYMFHHITDRWGNIPYSNALKGSEAFSPSFDSQEAVYADLFKELKEATAQIDGGAGVTGDVICGGDMELWKIFANSLRMVMALRLSNVNPTLAQAEFTAAQTAGVISSNDENIFYQFLNDAANENPWNTRFDTRLDFCLSNTLVDYMKPLADPRLDVFGNKAIGAGEVVGMPYGINNTDAGAIGNSEVSFLGAAMRAQDAPAYFVHYAQILFSQAEAAKLGWIPGGDAEAEALYKAGIKASWEQYGVFDQAAYDAFIATPAIAYTPATAIKQILTQKWVAGFLTGYESWAEWRRTGYPELAAAPAPLNPSGKIPVRQAYPTWESNLNKANYETNVANQGADDQDTPVWWDK